MTEREKLFNLATHSNNPAWRWLPNNAEMLRFVDYLLANGVTVQKWIPVSERMPEDGTKVLALAKNGRISECDCVKSYVERFGNYEQLTHWMPRPELPKEEA